MFPLQGCFQPLVARRSLTAAFVLAGSMLAQSAAGVAHADAYASDWSGADQSRVRLMAAGGGATPGTYQAAVEISLAPGWLTYWRQPGDAGVPPVFSFAGSQNLAGADVRYPAPTRIDEAGSEAFGYRGDTILPIRVTARDPSRPVVLDLTLDYAVCNQICVPAKAQGHLTLAAAAAPGPYAQTIAAAEADVPKRLAPAAAASDFALTAEPGTKVPTWRLVWKDAATAPTDLFAEAPAGWYFETHKAGSGDGFLIAAVQKPKGATVAEGVVMTAKKTIGSVEFTIRLDAARIDR